MIEIETRQLSGHEIIHAFSAGKGEQPLPTVVFYHGFLSSKLVYSYFAVALAQAGFRWSCLMRRIMGHALRAMSRRGWGCSGKRCTAI